MPWLTLAAGLWLGRATAPASPPPAAVTRTVTVAAPLAVPVPPPPADLGPVLERLDRLEAQGRAASDALWRIQHPDP